MMLLLLLVVVVGRIGRGHPWGKWGRTIESPSVDGPSKWTRPYKSSSANDDDDVDSGSDEWKFFHVWEYCARGPEPVRSDTHSKRAHPRYPQIPWARHFSYYYSPLSLSSWPWRRMRPLWSGRSWSWWWWTSWNDDDDPTAMPMIFDRGGCDDTVRVVRWRVVPYRVHVP